MNSIKLFTMLALAGSSFAPAAAQEVPAPAAAATEATQAPIIAMPKAQEQGTSAILPANTELILSMNEELTTKGKAVAEGHKFRLTLTHDVVIGDHIAIPKGTPAVGEVTWLTSKGAFGKSGKMEIALRYLDFGGRRIPIEGTYRQEGEGNTVATVAGVVAVGIFAAFITGKSARIPQGRELKAHTKEDLQVVLAKTI